MPNSNATQSHQRAFKKHSRGSGTEGCGSTSAPPPTTVRPHHRPYCCAMKLRVSHTAHTNHQERPHKFEELQAVVQFQTLSQTKSTKIPDLVLPLQNMRHLVAYNHEKLQTLTKQMQRRANAITLGQRTALLQD
jgi:hypothetical protein